MNIIKIPKLESIVHVSCKHNTSHNYWCPKMVNIISTIRRTPSQFREHTPLNKYYCVVPPLSLIVLLFL